MESKHDMDMCINGTYFYFDKIYSESILFLCRLEIYQGMDAKYVESSLLFG